MNGSGMEPSSASSRDDDAKFRVVFFLLRSRCAAGPLQFLLSVLGRRLIAANEVQLGQN